MIIIIFIILIYYIFYKNYHNYPISNIINIKYNNPINLIEKKIPFVYTINLKIQNYISREILLKDYSYHKINVLKNFKKINHNNLPTIKEMTIKSYINNYIDQNNNDYYFKTEDEYNFLKEIDIYNDLIKLFYNYSPKYCFKSLSFWYGSKNTCTPFHYDCDHANLLYIIEGSKRIYMVHPKYEKYMNGDRKIQYGASWSSNSIDDVIINLKNNNIEYEEIILRKGQLLNIPRYWWHCVINIEPTMAITYHYYTFSSFFIPYKTL